MNEETQQFQPPTANTAEPGSRCLTITQAAEAIGVDSFTMLSFIQRGKVNPTRSPSGEIMVPESELATLIEKGR
jgi:predicted site-specific integrase-resolvase